MQYLVGRNPVMEALEMDMGVTNLYIQKGELKGFIKKIEKKAVELKMDKITIFYDYQGIESWANGDWKTNNNLTKNYKKFIDEIKSQIDINFVKVKGHSNDTYNDMADELAKEALRILIWEIFD